MFKLKIPAELQMFFEVAFQNEFGDSKTAFDLRSTLKVKKDEVSMQMEQIESTCKHTNHEDMKECHDTSLTLRCASKVLQTLFLKHSSESTATTNENSKSTFVQLRPSHVTCSLHFQLCFFNLNFACEVQRACVT